MQSLTAAEILDTWERALNEAPASRPVSLLALASRASSREELARLPLGKRDALLLALREQTFGSRFSCLADCPECGGALELEFDADEIRFSPPEKTEEPLRIEDRGLLIECWLPDSSGGTFLDLDAAGGTGLIPVPAAGTSLILEDGVQVTFPAGAAGGAFRPGDYRGTSPE